LNPHLIYPVPTVLLSKVSTGTFTTGPVIDSKAITDYPNILFAQGKQNKSIEIFTGSVEAEGLPFVPLKTLLDYPNYNPDWTNEQVLDYIHNALPILKDFVVDEILT
jgi:carboxylesterase type B